MDSLRQEKVQKFEEFVDRRLKPDLVRAIAERDKVFAQQKIFLDLRKNLENLEKNSVTSLRTLVNLGSEVYMQAEVPDTQRIFVDIGLGFHVEFTWSEALKFISLREEKLESSRVASLVIFLSQGGGFFFLNCTLQATRGVYPLNCINQSPD
ncbi:hypothetical protein DITRI_Ditri17bG0121400 [Diplodiscus trichospermus]